MGFFRGAGVFSGNLSAPPAGPEDQRSISPALIEVVVRNGLGLSGIEVGRLVEVVGERFLGGLFCFPTVGPHGELGLRRSPGGMDQRRGSRLADVGQDSGDGLRVGEERNEGEGFLAGRTDERKDFIDPGQESSPPGGTGGGGSRFLRC